MLLVGLAHAKKKPPQATQADYSVLLTAKQDAVQQCAMDNGISVGAQRVDVSVHLALSGKGEILSLEVHGKLTGGTQSATPALEKCVEQQLRAIHFPRSDKPLIQIERSWTISTG